MPVVGELEPVPVAVPDAPAELPEAPTELPADTPPPPPPCAKAIELLSTKIEANVAVVCFIGCPSLQTVRGKLRPHCIVPNRRPCLFVTWLT
jgi:hypothetical protein